MSNSSLRDRVNANFKKHLGQYQPKDMKTGAYQKVTPEEVYNLLQDCSYPCRPAARDLIRKMSVSEWTIKSAPKKGGFDPGAPLHITIDVPVNSSKPAYHLNCKEIESGLVIVEITQNPVVDARRNSSSAKNPR